MSSDWEFDRPQRFIAGTVGMPGEREFYLQVRDDRRLISVLLEKQQVALLAEKVIALLDREVPHIEANAADLGSLELPLEAVFRVESMSLGWDPDEDQVIVEAAGSTRDGDQVDLSVRLPAAGARAFAIRALAVVGQGRPPCPLCSQPLDPAGHLCPRANGFKRR